MRAKPAIAAGERATAVRSTLISQRTGPLTASPKGEALFVRVAAHLRAAAAAGLAAAVHNIFIRAQLGQAHGAAGVELLGADAHLAAKAELAAVGKAGAGVHVDRRAVHRR